MFQPVTEKHSILSCELRIQFLENASEQRLQQAVRNVRIYLDQSISGTIVQNDAQGTELRLGYAQGEARTQFAGSSFLVSENGNAKYQLSIDPLGWRLLVSNYSHWEDFSSEYIEKLSAIHLISELDAKIHRVGLVFVNKFVSRELAVAQQQLLRTDHIVHAQLNSETIENQIRWHLNYGRFFDASNEEEILQRVSYEARIEQDGQGPLYSFYLINEQNYMPRVLGPMSLANSTDQLPNELKCRFDDLRARNLVFLNQNLNEMTLKRIGLGD